MQENYSAPVNLLGAHEPSVQDRTVWSCEVNITKFRGLLLRSSTRVALFGWRNRRAGRMYRYPPQADTAEDTARKIEKRQDEENSSTD